MGGGGPNKWFLWFSEKIGVIALQELNVLIAVRGQHYFLCEYLLHFVDGRDLLVLSSSGWRLGCAFDRDFGVLFGLHM